MKRKNVNRISMITWLAFLCVGLYKAILMLRDRFMKGVRFGWGCHFYAKKDRTTTLLICAERNGKNRCLGQTQVYYSCKAELNDLVAFINKRLAATQLTMPLYPQWKAYVVERTSMKSIPDSIMKRHEMPVSYVQLYVHITNSWVANYMTRNHPDIPVDNRPCIRGMPAELNTYHFIPPAGNPWR